MGVDIFYVLSGYLISYLLLKEWQRDGGINTARFLWRRWLRITPTYAFAVALELMVGRGWGPGSTTRASCSKYWWSTMLFLNNYYYHTPVDFAPWECLGQAWSIATEFQFYLVSPIIIWVTMARKVPMCLTAFILTGLALFLRWYFFQKYGVTGEVNAQLFVYDKVYTRMPPYLAGMAAAHIFLESLGHAKSPLQSMGCWARWSLHGVFSIIWAVSSFFGQWGKVYLGDHYFYQDGMPDPLGKACYISARAFFGLSVAYFALMSIWGKARLMKWFLKMPMWRPLARLSYGAYVLQHVIIDPTVDWINFDVSESQGTCLWKLIVFMSISISMTFILAFFANIFVEQPIMRMRDRLTPSWEWLRHRSVGVISQVAYTGILVWLLYESITYVPGGKDYVYRQE